MIGQRTSLSLGHILVFLFDLNSLIFWGANVVSFLKPLERQHFGTKRYLTKILRVHPYVALYSIAHNLAV